MKLYVIRARRMAVYLVALSAALLALFAVNMGKNNDALAVFSTRKEIPIYSVDVPEKAASITFDCAWGAGDIPDILNTLKEADIKATFFLVGQWAEKHPDTVRLIAQDGHDIANHSYSHFRMGSLDRGKVSSEISQCGELLEKLTGTKCDLFRAPYGDYNNTVLAEARKQGYFTIQWDVDSLDWKPGIAKEEILRRIRSKIKPGSIILFHNDTPHTAKLLPDIISEMKTAGYRFVPVSKLIIRENYYIDHEGRQKTSHKNE
jgi:polysaccharide deacetylase family sporulation protein PdaB